MSKITNNICELCGIKSNSITKHHLIPQAKHNSKTKQKFQNLQKTISICSLCHTTIHSRFSINQLTNQLNTLNKLMENQQIKNYLLWRKKHPNFNCNSTKLKNK